MATTTTLSHPHLQRLLADLEAVDEGARQLRADLSQEQLAWKPTPEAWSVLECFEHLIVTGELYHPRIRQGLGRARRTGADAPFRPRLFGRLFLRSLDPEATRKLKTFNAFKPARGTDDVAIIDRFLAQQDDFRALLHEADGVDLNSGVFSSPLTRLLRFTVGEGLTIVVVHQQRHLGQARRLTQLSAFPEG